MEEKNASKVDATTTTTTIATFTQQQHECQKFDDQHLHTLVTHQEEILDNNVIWL